MYNALVPDRHERLITDFHSMLDKDHYSRDGKFIFSNDATLYCQLSNGARSPIRMHSNPLRTATYWPNHKYAIVIIYKKTIRFADIDNAFSQTHGDQIRLQKNDKLKSQQIQNDNTIIDVYAVSGYTDEALRGIDSTGYGLLDDVIVTRQNSDSSLDGKALQYQNDGVVPDPSFNTVVNDPNNMYSRLYQQVGSIISELPIGRHSDDVPHIVTSWYLDGKYHNNTTGITPDNFVTHGISLTPDIKHNTLEAESLKMKRIEDQEKIRHDNKQAEEEVEAERRVEEARIKATLTADEVRFKATAAADKHAATMQQIQSSAATSDTTDAFKVAGGAIALGLVAFKAYTHFR